MNTETDDIAVKKKQNLAIESQFLLKKKFLIE